MKTKYNKNLIPNARTLRTNMTKEERHLWYDFLRSYPLKFRRQVIVNDYILDFYCPEIKLAVELDGSQHYQNEGMQYDMERTERLSAYGITVLRIPNNEVNGNFAGVCQHIDLTVKKLKAEQQNNTVETRLL